MRENNIERAVIMPFNDPFLMSMAFSVDAVHRNLFEIPEILPLNQSMRFAAPLPITRWTASSFTRTIPLWRLILITIALSSHLRRNAAFPWPFIPIQMQMMICLR